MDSNPMELVVLQEEKVSVLFHIHALRKGPCEDTMRRLPSANKEESPHQTDHAATLTLTYTIQNSEKVNFWYVSHPVYSILL